MRMTSLQTTSSSSSSESASSSSSSSARLFFLSSLLCVFGLVIALLIILLLPKQQQQQHACDSSSTSNQSVIADNNELQNYHSKTKNNDNNDDNGSSSLCSSNLKVSPLITHDLIFLGDSNTLGMLSVNRSAGYQLHGGYPRIVIERRNSYLAKYRNNNKNKSLSASSPLPASAKEIPFYFSHDFKFPGSNISHSSVLLNHFYAPTAVYAIGSSGLSSSVAIPYQQSEPFADAKDRLSNLTSPTIVFIMFGTNDAMKGSSKESTSKKFIRQRYKEFIDLVLSLSSNTKTSGGGNEKEKKLKKIVMITPPRIQPRCGGRVAFCRLINADVLENTVVPVVRKLFREYSLNSSSSHSVEFQLIDFYEYLATQFLTESDKEKLAEAKSSLANNNRTDEENDDDDNDLFMRSERKKRQQHRRTRMNVISRSIRKYFQRDGIHLSVEGHELLGKLVWDSVSKKEGGNWCRD